MRRLVLTAGLVLAMLSPALAEEIRSSLWPEVPKASGEPHPEGNAEMRRKHMSMMKHDRDMTLREGEREIDASLAECFECHSVKDAAGGYVTYESEKHFCRTCHDFAAVKVDCFMCHRSTPEGFEEPPLHAMGLSLRADMELAQGYLEKTLGTDSGRTE